ncbi:nucleotide-binding alpha-beta plait domain-containing protein [Tanacetum coccineum]|uniref:Nucleotide-binding alpha-beta plait domain-containing protein n=1 Tax=Tanacetum coccineum TaxID=301880 RepID=A0ABQ5AVF8_9ASTR
MTNEETHREAKGLWDFRFPYYDQLSLVYRRGLAPNAAVEARGDYVNNMEVVLLESKMESGSEDLGESDDSYSGDEENDVHVVSQPSPTQPSPTALNNDANETPVATKRNASPDIEDGVAKRSKTTPSPLDIGARLDEINTSFQAFVEGFNANFATMTKFMTNDNIRQKSDSEKLKDVIDELMKLSLSSDDVFKREIFATNKNKMDVFISLPDKLRVSYVIKAFNANFESITNAVTNAATEDNAREKMASEKLKEVIVEIMKHNLTNEDIFKAADMFAAERNRIYVFFGLPEELQAAYVSRLTGFDVVKISYLGELWVLLEFETAKAKDSFRGNVGVGSWFSVIKQAYAEFVPEGRLVWVELDGVPFKFWSGPTFKRIAAKWGELLDVDDYDESNLHSKRICILSKVCEHIHESFKIVFRGKVYWVRASEVLGWTPEFSEEEEEDELSVEDNNDGRINDLEANNGIDESDVEEVLETLFDQPDDQKDKHSEDPFGLYPLLNKENIELARKVTEEDHSLSHPPGFTPEEGLNEGNTVNLDMKDYGENERDDNSFVNLEDGKDNSESVNKNSESKRSGHSKYSVLPRTGGSILNLMEEVVKVGQTMGYNMDGCIKDITEIIESQGEFGVNR